MRRFTAVLLALCFATLASGAVESVHNAHHAAQDARLQRIARAAGRPAPATPPHDESNCSLHLQLHLPALPVLIAPPAISIGRLVCMHSTTASQPEPRRVVIRLDCRGPPAHVS